MGRIYCLTWLVVLFLLSLNKFLNYFQRKRKRMWKCNIRISKRFLTYQLIVNCMQRINCIHVSSVSGEHSNKTAKWRMFLVQRYQKVPKSLGNSGKFRKKFFDHLLLATLVCFSSTLSQLNGAFSALFAIFRSFLPTTPRSNVMLF